MGRFEPSADPIDAVKRGFYVPQPGRSIAEQLAARFELKPSASHLLVGGVGSGKTTQLLVARDRLAAAGDICALYIDVSILADPTSIDATRLLAVLGFELGEQLYLSQKTQEIDRYLNAFEDYLKRSYAWEGDPFPFFAAGIDHIYKAMAGRYPHLVLLIDSLDRMSELGSFAAIIESAVMRLRSLGIGVIMVGPLASLYGIERVILDRVDRVWHLPAVDIESDAEGRDFLRDVLRARDVEGLLTDKAAARLAALSGGVLRDLMALTQAAGEEAYVDGAERVEERHVDIAADLFGRKHLMAIDSEQLALLQQVRTKGTFVQTSEKHLALLSTRRVLEYMNGKPRFAVHPTIEPLLAQIAGAP
jgi:Cdc6-like AAA superfamily ATPase